MDIQGCFPFSTYETTESWPTTNPSYCRWEIKVNPNAPLEIHERFDKAVKLQIDRRETKQRHRKHSKSLRDVVHARTVHVNWAVGRLLPMVITSNDE